MKKCVFAGSFDPFTKGHLNVVKKALKTYDLVYVALMNNQNKDCFFSLSERFEILKTVFSGEEKVKVVFWDGFLVDFLSFYNVTDNVRGIRNEEDKKYETVMYNYNKKLYPDIKNIYVTPDNDVIKISSSAFKKAIFEGGDYLSYLPENVREKVKEILLSKKEKIKN